MDIEMRDVEVAMKGNQVVALTVQNAALTRMVKERDEVIAGLEEAIRNFSKDTTDGLPA